MFTKIESIMKIHYRPKLHKKFIPFVKLQDIIYREGYNSKVEFIIPIIDSWKLTPKKLIHEILENNPFDYIENSICKNHIVSMCSKKYSNFVDLILTFKKEEFPGKFLYKITNIKRINELISSISINGLQKELNKIITNYKEIS